MFGIGILKRLRELLREPQVLWIPLREDSKMPQSATDGSSGYDVFASRVLDRKTKEVIGDLPFTINPGESALFGIGVAFEVKPPCYPPLLSPRGGFEPKLGIKLGGAPGIIDSDFRGESTVFLVNEGDQPFTVEKNMRIAQLVFCKVERPEWIRVASLSQTRRGEGSFGSTGLKEIKK